MKIEIIINPKRGIISGIHKVEDCIMSIIKEIEPSVSIIPVNEFKRPNFPRRLFYLLLNLFLPAFSSKNSRKTDEILYFSDQQLSLLLNFIRINKKIIIMVYDIFPSTEFYKSHLSLFDRYRYGLVVKALKKADRLITVTEMTKKELVKTLNFDARKIDIVYLGIDHSLYYPRKNILDFKKKLNISEKDKIVLCVSSEEPRKNIEGLIKAFRELKKIIPDCKLIKIGKAGWPGARDRLLKVVSDLELSNSVIFKEDIPEEEMPFFYSMADVFVSVPFYEGGWAIPVAEAMACGCPVVASSPALEELVRDCGILVDAGNYVEIAEAMRSVLGSSEKTKILREKSIIRSLAFSWDETARGIIDSLKK